MGRDQVMNIMRGLGMQGVRRGKTPDAAKPAKGAGGRPDLVDRKFEAEAPNRLHVADIMYCFNVCWAGSAVFFRSVG